ncbi:universal stress protein [Halorussus sp. MSC15.2]|uniref:universal stress protein n=1 Tax=Halorussus sp. MSC15.2 TaxID=2283638 RepID=UPI0013D6E0E0|nr:universal stress protein [Halorussus sp. MSC15.2]NEU58187.1 universal stress protein [Halorussus sp. MSC15.2]
MERALAVVDAEESTKALVREAGELAAAVDASLVLLHVTTDDEYEEKRQTMESIPNDAVGYSEEKAREGAEAFAADIGREALDGIDVSWEAVGALGNEQTEILDAAERYDCDHLFIAGKKRSPAGKALFGDLTQSIILNFTGPVTVVTE